MSRAKSGEIQAFIANAVIADSPACVVWPFARMSNGYAVMRSDGKVRLAHRVVCELVHGAPPSSKHEAAHSCGNGPGGCINPAHLRWATRLENDRDKLAHGTHLRGSRHGASRLTEQQVIEIRSRLAVDGAYGAAGPLADEFGVSHATISRVRHGVDWGWLNAVPNNQ